MSAAAGYAGASSAAIEHHYDVGDAFYALFLDASRTYSCALFADGDSLETAQQRKHDWHAEHAGARGARRVLDVGCGWGATCQRLLDAHAVERVVGLTLSRAQAERARAVCGRAADIRLESWAEHVPPAPYDAIVSIGAFEHFARHGLPPAEKLDAYRRYFQRCHALLRPGARMTLQTIAWGAMPRERAHRDVFIAQDVFPESDLPRLADVALACEGTFEVVRLRNDRADYERTCREWFRRLRANRAAAVATAGEDVVRRYERYLRTFSYSFGLGAFDLLRIAFRRIDRRRSDASEGVA